MKYFFLLPLFISTVISNAGGDKAPTASVSFHLEGAAAEAPKISRAVVTEAGEGYFRIIPEISNRDLESYSPFPAEEDNTYGAVFKLNKQGARKLELATTGNQGRFLLSIINGTPHEVVHIDKPIKDGMIVIWRGLNIDHINLCDQILPRINEDPADWKKRAKELKKTLKKRAKD
ncbi:MAG: hypothetical protein ACSHX0_04465 [Akkermansiaceae bacterium]